MPAQNKVDEAAKDDVWKATMAQATREKMKDTVHRQIEQNQVNVSRETRRR